MSPLRQRLPKNVGFTKAEMKRYMGYIAALPCLICGKTPVHVCHVRFTEMCPNCDREWSWKNMPGCWECLSTGHRYGKRPTGAGEKPSDVWTWPGCPECHLHGPEAQHSSGERQWFQEKGIDILALCVALQDAYNTALSRADAIEGGVAVLEEFRRAA